LGSCAVAMMSGTGRPECDRGGPQRPGVVEPGQEVRGLDVINGESIHRVTASARQAPGQGPWPGEPTSGSYSFRQIMRSTASTIGGSLR
jgi:hypothetical protein